jgi:hypothetical protein
VACWGRNPGGSVRAVWALRQTGPPPTQARSAFKRALRPTEARFIAAKSYAGMTVHGRRSRVQGATSRDPHGPRDNYRHTHPRDHARWP